jgi:hypothetical protein
MEKDPEISNLPPGWLEVSSSPAGRLIRFDVDDDPRGYVTEIYVEDCRGYVFPPETFPGGEKEVCRGFTLEDTILLVESAAESYRAAYHQKPRQEVASYWGRRFPYGHRGYAEAEADLD